MTTEYRLIPDGYAPDSRTLHDRDQAETEARDYRAPDGARRPATVEQRHVTDWEPLTVHVAGRNIIPR